jgi:hypothetical protein
VDGGASGSGTVTATLGLGDSALGLGDGGCSGSVKGMAALRLGLGDGVAQALGDDGARGRGWRGLSSVKGTAALGLGEGDGVARALGDSGARARGRGRWCSSLGTGTAALGFVLGDGDTTAAWRRTVSARAGRVRVPTDQRAFYIVKNPGRIFSKTACDRQHHRRLLIPTACEKLTSQAVDVKNRL